MTPLSKLKEEAREEFSKKFVAKDPETGIPTYTQHPDLVKSFIDSLLTKLAEEATKAMVVEEKELPKTKCLNAENHLFGSCFECEKIKGHNSARADQLARREKFLNS